MWTAIWVTLLIFGFMISGMLVLKRSASSFKIPKGVKPQPYQNDEETNKESSNQKPTQNNDTRISHDQ